MPRVSLARQLTVRVPSSSDPETVYIVTLAADGSWKCTCPAFRHGSRMDGECKHIDQVRDAHADAVSAARTLSE